MPAAIACLSSCTPASYNICPRYPVAGAEVAVELEKLGAGEYPRTWEWLGRINKLRQELDICAKIEKTDS